MKNVLGSESPFAHKIVFPFKIEIDPMERLLVVSLKGSPEFTEIEPQVFNDPVNGKGMRILLYRKDRKVDIYWQPGVLVDRDTITVGNGIGHFKETVIQPSRFEITDHGVDIAFEFTDAEERKVEFKVIENTSGIKRFPFLAPVGTNIDNPKRLFFVYMPEFDFVRKKGTDFIAKIGDKTLCPKPFPILRNYQKVLLMRYSGNLVIGTLNPPLKKPLTFELVKLPDEIEVDGMTINVNKDRKITKVVVAQTNQKVELNFPNGFPNLLDVVDGVIEKGTWLYRICDNLITGGTYSISRSNNSIDIQIDVTRNWKPTNMPLSFRLFTGLVRSFRTWPKTYSWKGIVNLGNDTLTGTWKRKK